MRGRIAPCQRGAERPGTTIFVAVPDVKFSCRNILGAQGRRMKKIGGVQGLPPRVGVRTAAHKGVCRRTVVSFLTMKPTGIFTSSEVCVIGLWFSPL